MNTRMASSGIVGHVFLVIFSLKQRCDDFFRLYKRIMKSILLLWVACLLHFSCKKSVQETKPFQNNGVIAGMDARLCPCVVSCPCVCGTLIFHFTDTVYAANIPIDNPGIFNLTSSTHFPVYVRVNWVNTTRCGVTAIKITSFELY
jgi:hypothetical protein